MKLFSSNYFYSLQHRNFCFIYFLLLYFIYSRNQDTGNWCPKWQTIKLKATDIIIGTHHINVNNTEENRKNVELFCRWQDGMQYSPEQAECQPTHCDNPDLKINDIYNYNYTWNGEMIEFGTKIRLIIYNFNKFIIRQIMIFSSITVDYICRYPITV